MNPSEALLANSTFNLISLIWCLLGIVAFWVLFRKAGQHGWGAIIPIYNFLLMLRIAGRPWWWILLMLIPFVNIVLWIIVVVNFTMSYGKGALFAVGMIFFPVIFGLILAFGSAQYQGPIAAPEAPA